MGERSTMRAVEEMYDAARDEPGSDSDADTLVEFRGPATFDRYMDLKILLEELLGYPVDLVTRKASNHACVCMLRKKQ